MRPDGRRFQFIEAALDAGLLAQVILARLVRVVLAFFLGEALQGTHGLSHLLGVHPLGQGVFDELLAFGEEFQPSGQFGVDLLGLPRPGGELAKFQQPDAAVVEQGAPLIIAHPEPVGIVRQSAPQRFAKQPDGVGGPQFAIVLTALELGAIQVRPAVEDAGGQVGQDQQLDLDLEEASLCVARFDIDDGEFIVQELPLIIGVQDLHLDHRCRQVTAQGGVQEVDQQPTVALGPEQGLEDTVDLGVDGVLHRETIA